MDPYANTLRALLKKSLPKCEVTVDEQGISGAMAYTFQTRLDQTLENEPLPYDFIIILGNKVIFTK